MPPTYKYGFLPKSREKALRAASSEFYEAKKLAKKLQQDTEGLNERLRSIEALLGFGVHAVWPDGELRKRLEDVIGKE
jgi:hypothetical protein